MIPKKSKTLFLFHIAKLSSTMMLHHDIIQIARLCYLETEALPLISDINTVDGASDFFLAINLLF